jgi:hypothetical protein
MIWNASIRLFDAAVEKAYGGKRMIERLIEAAIIKDILRP